MVGANGRCVLRSRVAAYCSRVFAFIKMRLLALLRARPPKSPLRHTLPPRSPHLRAARARNQPPRSHSRGAALRPTDFSHWQGNEKSLVCLLRCSGCIAQRELGLRPTAGGVFFGGTPPHLRRSSVIDRDIFDHRGSGYVGHQIQPFFFDPRPFTLSLRELGSKKNATHSPKHGRTNPICAGRSNPIPDKVQTRICLSNLS